MATRKIIRDFQAGGHLDLFLVTAVAAILVIRLFLQLTGFPQLGNDQLHVAHMLWGGLLMLAAIVILLSFVGRAGHRLSAVLGGAGFGMFIDEVGKFVTQDNDYFFQPAPAIIYVVMVLTYIAIRAIHARGPRAPVEYLVNALQEAQEVAVEDLDRNERARALEYLEHCDPLDPLVAGLRRLIAGADVVAPPQPGVFARAAAAAARLYHSLADRPWFGRVVAAFFVGQLAVQVVHVTVVLALGKSWLNVLMRRPLEALGSGGTGVSYFEGALAAFSALAAALVAAGAWQIRRSRLAAFRNFQRSILVSLLLVQPLMFYRDQWSALIGLAFDIAVFVALRFIIEREEFPSLRLPNPQEVLP